MGRAREPKGRAPKQPEPLLGIYDIDSGSAEIAFGDQARSYELYVNGVPSSCHHLDDPTRLTFPYLAVMAGAIVAQASSAPLHVVHVGAAGCALPRALLGHLPKSTHLAIEVDAALATLVRQQFSLPRAPSLRIRVGDGLGVLQQLAASSCDVVVRDAFAGSVTPPSLCGTEFWAATRHVLRPGGLMVANVGVLARKTFELEVGPLREAYPSVVLCGEPAVLAGRREGNVVAIAMASDETLTPAVLGAVRRAAPDWTVRAV